MATLKNIQYKVTGDQLQIVVPLGKAGWDSTGGKMKLIASSGGFFGIDYGPRNVRFSLLVGVDVDDSVGAQPTQRRAQGK